LPAAAAVDSRQELRAHPHLEEAEGHIGEAADDHGDGELVQALEIVEVQPPEQVG
jgi:hypothetical protein